MFAAALVILSLFKALLLCHGPMLLMVMCMFFTVRSPSLRPWSHILAIVGSFLCPLACPELCAMYLGTGPIWELFEDTRHAFAGLKEEVRVNPDAPLKTKEETKKEN